MYSVSGDGGFGQYMGEWTTAVKYNMNIRHVLLNNKELGKISKEQRAGDWPVWESKSLPSYPLCPIVPLIIASRSQSG